MSRPAFRMATWRPALFVLCVLAGLAAALVSHPAPAAAALPESATTCSGSLLPDARGASLGQPNLLDYSFYCSTPITSYTIVANRVRYDSNNIDDFSPNVTVISNGTPSATESVNCGGQLPSDGINCYSLNGSAAGPLNAGDEVQGAFDLTDRYCAYLPQRAKAGTPAVPRATVEVIVTDSSGAEDGPFELSPARACPRVPAVVPAKATARKRVRSAHLHRAISRRQG